MKSCLFFWLVVALCLSGCLGAASGSSISEWPLQLHTHLAPTNGVPLLDPPYHSAGFLPLNDTNHAELFYFYFQERSKDPDAPLVFWTNGGPGCSSLYGLFTENGPYEIQPDLTLKYTEYGWDQGANILFVEQPVGTGFSRSSDDGDYARYEPTVGENMLMFFLKFMEIHPELAGKDLYLSGESYAGHYLPAIAKAIYDANQSGQFMHLNLRGVFVGNPWTAPLAHEFSYPAFGAAHGLITQEEADTYTKNGTLCTTLYQDCNTSFNPHVCRRAGYVCYEELQKPVFHNEPDMNYYDIRKLNFNSTDAYDESLLYKFLNSPGVQEKLGVHAQWIDCSDKVGKYMEADIMIDMTDIVKYLLNGGLRYLVYVGDQDFICNWFGNKAWLDALEWNRADQWTGILSPWKVKTKTRGLMGAGDCETVLPLSFCTIYDSGHMVPMDQPEMAYNMMRTFIAGGTFVPETGPTMFKNQFAVS